MTVLSARINVRRCSQHLSMYGGALSTYQCAAVLSAPINVRRCSQHVLMYGGALSTYQCAAVLSAPINVRRCSQHLSMYGGALNTYQCMAVLSAPINVRRCSQHLSMYAVLSARINVPTSEESAPKPYLWDDWPEVASLSSPPSPHTVGYVDIAKHPFLPRLNHSMAVKD